MKGTLDNFIIKNQTENKLPNKKRKPSDSQSPAKIIEKTKKLPLSVELDLQKKSIPKNSSMQITSEPVKIPSDPLKFYSSYNDFISQLDTWQAPLKSFLLPPNNNKMMDIYTFVKKEYETKTIFPPKDLIFNAFKKTKWDNLKIVIIGQDPYPNPGDACGMSFSVPKGQKIPPSLVNIFKCLKKDNKIKFEYSSHGDLTKWAEQGVFLINATLTVECKKANSHQKISGWNYFTDYVIKTISDNKKNVVFLLWGNFAIMKKKLIDINKHLIIENIHPSPLAQKKGDFTSSDQFSKANEYLKEKGIEPIDWEL